MMSETEVGTQIRVRLAGNLAFEAPLELRDSAQGADLSAARGREASHHVTSLAMSNPDVLVLGAGPAGLALAGACARAGLSVAVMAPEPEAPWVPNYGAWAAELPPEWPTWTEATFPEAVVYVDDTRRHVLPGPYVRVDGRKLQVSLLASVPDLRRGTARDAPPARLVIDATGAESPRVPRRAAADPGWQMAWGEVLEVDGATDEMMLMDWRAPPPPAGEPPSFLYAMPLPDGRWFAEETVLVSRPGLPLDVLRLRLGRRLDRMGVRVRARHEVERCRIPMGMPLPTGAVPAFGAAAGFIHPATGYSLATSLRLADPAARAIAGALRGHVGSNVAAVTALHEACWPAERARAWAFYRFGMEALLRMDLASTREFFDTFFRHSPEVWRAWLGGDLPPAGIAAAMLAHFGRVGWTVRGQLVATSLGPEGMRLLSDLVRPG